MNVEMFFLGTAERDAVIDRIKMRLQQTPDPVGLDSEWGLPSSYYPLLVREKKRRVAVSPVIDGWIAGVESKEVVDFSLLQTISKQLEIVVVAVQVSDAVGACGYALCDAGSVMESRYDENEEDPLGASRAYLRKHGITIDILTFREAVQLIPDGWAII